MPVDPNEPTYCLCHQVSYGEMIGCDNPDVSNREKINILEFFVFSLNSNFLFTLFVNTQLQKYPSEPGQSNANIVLRH